jgi:non-specific serine/threonine protein kinase/serine/threonine-protein kinase
MTPERWDRVSEIMEHALSVGGSEREEYLARACAGDPEVRGEVESLLASHQQAGSRFLNVTEAAAAAPVLVYSNRRLGRRIGPYLVEELIGHGGMGEVYAAVRADGQYEKRVALKLVRGEYDSGFILERFRNERQILATLVHPNIAQLLDGGTTDDGVPYLVLELVEGAPIDSYCAEHNLTVTQRLELFRMVCSAVQYAHQHLVIHRDIKPGNIFVTKDGTPKLLDFGIAKIVEESGSAEMTAFRPMTPEFASPEQVQGKPITTASDVYSLGVVLYRLLTGQSPYRAATASAHEISRAITDREPVVPSAAALREGEGDNVLAEGSPAKLVRRLRGDLDCILLKALRKEPQYRYGSVEQFSEDIRRHLEGLPVYARKGTWSYRAVKFVQRHRAGVLAAALAFASLAGSTVVTIREARIAEANRQRAERRFNDVRKLANSLMFEVHDSIRQLPGSTAARKLIMERAQQYLDSLADESRSDPSLLREMATAYVKLATVQGDALNANLGNSALALKNYRKAVELREAAFALAPKDVDSQRELAGGYLDLAMALLRTGDRVGSKDSVQKALQLLESAITAHPNDRKTQSSLGRAYERAGLLASTENNPQRALELQEKSLAMYQQASAADPADRQAQVLVAFAHKHIGSLLVMQKQPEKALEHYRVALALDEENLSKDPENAQTRYNITFTYSDTGYILNTMGDSDGALKYYAKAMEIRQSLVAADPEDVRARRGLSNTYNYIGVIHRDRHEYAEALDYLKKSLEIRTALATKDPSNDQGPLEVADSQAQIGFVYSAMALGPHSDVARKESASREAVKWMEQALPVYLQRQAQNKLTGTEVTMPGLLAEQIDKCNRLLGHSIR